MKLVLCAVTTILLIFLSACTSSIDAQREAMFREVFRDYHERLNESLEEGNIAIVSEVITEDLLAATQNHFDEVGASHIWRTNVQNISVDVRVFSETEATAAITYSYSWAIPTESGLIEQDRVWYHQIIATFVNSDGSWKIARIVDDAS